MKNCLVLIFCLLSCALWAQISPPTSNTCGISYGYDNAGNRIRRNICIGMIEIAFRETTVDEQITQTIDREQLQAQGNYSEALEREIAQLEALLAQDPEADAEKEETKDVATLRQQLSSFENLSELVVFPNPTAISFSLRGDELQASDILSLHTMDGRLLLQRALGDGNDIDVSEFPNGTYVISLQSQDSHRVALLVKTDSQF